MTSTFTRVKLTHVQILTAVLSLLLLFLSACGSSPTSTTTTTQNALAPVTITDCGGRKTNYTQIPQRIVAMDGMAAEMLFALGIHNRVVAIGYPNPQDQIDPAYLSDYKKAVIFSAYPSKEELAGQRPDLVISTLPSAFTSAYANYSQDQLAQLHVASFLGLGSCPSEHFTTLDATYTDFFSLGALFRVEARAQQLVAQMKATVASVQKQTTGLPRVRVMSYGGEQVPYVVGRLGTANIVINLAGGTNVFSDIATKGQTVTWESVVARDPQVIWLIPNDNGAGSCCTPAAMEQFLLHYAPIANVSAIKNKRFVVVYQDAGEYEGAYNAQAVLNMARGLFPGQVK
jgi:iron complex transport system substrate-binding protein